MDGREAELSALRAQADREIALASEAYRRLVAVARRQLANGKDAADVWALMTTQMALEFGCTTKQQQFAVEMLFAAVIEAAQDELMMAEPEYTYRIWNKTQDWFAVGEYTDTRRALARLAQLQKVFPKDRIVLVFEKSKG